LIPGKGKIFLFLMASIPDLGLSQSPIQQILGALSLEEKVTIA
jgi:hypothetical protein